MKIFRLIVAASCGALFAHASAAQDSSARDTTHRTSIAADYEYDAFRGDMRDWHFASVSLGQRTDAGSIIGRLNYANRFGVGGEQVEADAYPGLGKGRYAYLNVGYSGSSIFPRWRSGAEFFTILPRAYEASIGYRQLRFEGTTPVTLITGAVGKYSGNYWFSLRPYLREKENGLSASASMTARRYYEDANHYIGARIGFGSTPSDELTITELRRTSSFAADVHGSNRLADRLFGTWTIGYEREQLPQSLIRTRLEFTGGMRLEF